MHSHRLVYESCILIAQSLCSLQLVSIGMINIVVLFVTLDIGVYSNWFIAGTMLVCAIVMGEEKKFFDKIML